MAKANLSQLAISGQLLHGLNTDVKFDMRDKIIASLKEIGVSDADIHDAQAIWIAIFCDLLVSQITVEAQKLLPSAAAEMNKLPEAPRYGVPEPETLESWLASHKVSSPRLDQLMDEYKRLWTTGSMKYPSIIPFDSALRTKDR